MTVDIGENCYHDGDRVPVGVSLRPLRAALLSPHLDRLTAWPDGPEEIGRNYKG